jgi:hypothetical protein
LTSTSPRANRWRHPLVLIGLLIIVAIVVIVGMLFIDPAGRRDLEGTAASSRAAMPSGESHDLNERIKIGDEEYLTVTQVELWTGTENVKPRDNYSFVAVEVKVEGIRSSGASVDPFWFTLVDNEQQSHDVVESGKDPGLQQTDALAPETVASGWLTFEIPEQKGHGLTLVYAPPFASPAAVALD